MFYRPVLSVFFGAIGMPTLRMKYLWTPCMCIPGIFGINDYKFRRTILSPLKTKEVIISVKCRDQNTLVSGLWHIFLKWNVCD